MPGEINRRKTDNWWYPTIERVTLVLAVIVTVLAFYNSSNLRENSQNQCLRGNETRTAQIKAFLGIASGNNSRAKAWVKIKNAFPATTQVAEAQRKANLAEANRLRSIAKDIANAQRRVAVDPDAPNLVKRAIVDCEDQFGGWL